MKKTFKGFTLVECLVAMAILAIASTLMASIYANVNRRNNFNHFNNTSLANQMAYIEKYEKVQTVKIEYNVASSVTPPHKESAITSNQGTTAYVKITKLKSDGITPDTDPSSGNKYEYSYPVDIYIMFSRDTGNDASTTVTESGGTRTESANNSYSKMYAEQNNNLRYKYILGH